MSATSFSVKVYTPKGFAFDEKEAVSVTLPTSDGEIGILPQHVGYASTLGTGTLTITTTGGQVKKADVSEGFCKFKDDELVILADQITIQ